MKYSDRHLAGLSAGPPRPRRTHRRGLSRLRDRPQLRLRANKLPSPNHCERRDFLLVFKNLSRDFRPSDGGGYVAYKKADYAHALSRSDTDVQMYLFETFGGWCNAVKRLFYQMKDKVRNKLSKRQHEDEASWSTRSWLSLQAQRMSVALQLAAAEEIATELRLAAASEDAAVA